MKNWLSLVCLLALVATVIGCGPAKGTSTTPAPAGEAKMDPPNV